MKKVTVYSRLGCHLCEIAIDKIKLVNSEIDFELEIKLIDDDKNLQEKVNQGVPKVIAPFEPETPAQCGSVVRAESTKLEREPLAKRINAWVSSSISLGCSFPKAWISVGLPKNCCERAAG